MITYQTLEKVEVREGRSYKIGRTSRKGLQICNYKSREILIGEMTY